MYEDTIAAIATAMSSSGIGIIRISGEKSFAVIDQIFESPKKQLKLSEAESHTVHYGFIRDENVKIDEVLVLIMRAPHSYTGENTVEIDCHGGVFVMKKILDTVIRHGARPAQPGEFTKRAFLNGRMDLSQAEAVIDVINAKNQYALTSSFHQLRGSLSEKIIGMRKEIIHHIAKIESALDDPEHIILEGYQEELLSVVNGMESEIHRLLDTFENGRVFSEGIRTVILGKPNAGKSSLMNVLLGQDRAIVTELAGTTRDTLEENLRIGDINLNIVDTAGIRATDDVVELLGIEKAKSAAGQADLIIYVVDGSVPLDENDESIMNLIRDRKCIVILNKSDLQMKLTRESLEKSTGFPVISISTKEETGIDELADVVQKMFFRGEINFNDEVYLTNARHKTALEEARKSLSMVQSSVWEGLPEDFYSIDLMDAYRHLGAVIGEEVDDDLVDEIFSKFCMGK